MNIRLLAIAVLAASAAYASPAAATVVGTGPGGWLLVAAGFGGLMCVRRRRT